eukprot:55330-Prymnesium_polylepis.1
MTSEFVGSSSYVQIVSTSLISGDFGAPPSAFSPAMVVTVCRVVSAQAKRPSRSCLRGYGSARRATTRMSALKSEVDGALSGRRTRVRWSGPSSSTFCTAEAPMLAREMDATLNARSRTTWSGVPRPPRRQRTSYASGGSMRARRSASVPLRPGANKTSPAGAKTDRSVDVTFQRPSAHGG